VSYSAAEHDLEETRGILQEAQLAKVDHQAGHLDAQAAALALRLKELGNTNPIASVNVGSYSVSASAVLRW